MLAAFVIPCSTVIADPVWSLVPIRRSAADAVSAADDGASNQQRDHHDGQHDRRDQEAGDPTKTAREPGCADGRASDAKERDRCGRIH